MTVRFVQHPEANDRVESAIAIIQALLPLNIRPRMKRRFISNCLWQITQAEGKNKYDLRYRTQASLTAQRKNLRHEHVSRRKDMVTALMTAKPDEVPRIARGAIGCVVTKAEHALLDEVDRNHRSLDGWSRYQKAGIIVVDMGTGIPLRFAPLVP